MKAFQLRAARSVSGIGVREIALYLGVSGTIVSRWDNMSPFKTIKSNVTNPDALIFFFEQYKILFPSENSISFNVNSLHPTKYLSRFQLRASRSILGLSQRELAEATKTSQGIINYLESLDNINFINNTHKDIDTNLYKSFFEESGIIFPDNYSIILSSEFSQWFLKMCWLWLSTTLVLSYYKKRCWELKKYSTPRKNNKKIDKFE